MSQRAGLTHGLRRWFISACRNASARREVIELMTHREPRQVTIGPNDPVQARKPESRMVSFRVDEDDFACLDALARQTRYSRGEVLRRCLRGARLESTVDAQALTEVSRVHANLNRIGGLLKLAIREGVSDRATSHRLNLELIDSVIDVRRAVRRLAGQR